MGDLFGNRGKSYANMGDEYIWNAINDLNINIVLADDSLETNGIAKRKSKIEFNKCFEKIHAWIRKSCSSKLNSNHILPMDICTLVTEFCVGCLCEV